MTGNQSFSPASDPRGPAADYYVEQMAALLRKDKLEIGRPLKIIDLGCGDFEVAKALLKHLPDATYMGCDIVPNLVDHHSRIYSNERITFKVVDIVSDEVPDGDVCLIRQVFRHLPNADIAKALKKLKYKFIYITEGHPVERTGAINPDKGVGFDVRFDWRTGKGRGVELGSRPLVLEQRKCFAHLRHLRRFL
jgi:Methyltransferase domain